MHLKQALKRRTLRPLWAPLDYKIECLEEVRKLHEQANGFLLRAPPPAQAAEGPRAIIGSGWGRARNQGVAILSPLRSRVREARVCDTFPGILLPSRAALDAEC